MIAATTFLLATQPGEMFGGTRNPVGLDVSGTAPVILPVVAAVVLALIAGFVSAVVRYRRAEPTQRVQLREVVFAVCLTFVGFVADLGRGRPRRSSTPLDYALIPVAVGMAMLRYRLYDVDLVIRRTLVYGVLVAVLAARLPGRDRPSRSRRSGRRPASRARSPSRSRPSPSSARLPAVAAPDPERGRPPLLRAPRTTPRRPSRRSAASCASRSTSTSSPTGCSSTVRDTVRPRRRASGSRP